MADFDGDGKSDFVWQNDNGSAAIWLMDGTSIANGSNLEYPGNGWHVL